jgi:hypothetical protein
MEQIIRELKRQLAGEELTPEQLKGSAQTLSREMRHDPGPVEACGVLVLKGIPGYAPVVMRKTRLRRFRLEIHSPMSRSLPAS